ncbi:MAG: glycosyltransferase [Flavobacteriales bacterium]|nr:glycosyltransferase [Flavobacteriales bacterium]
MRKSLKEISSYYFERFGYDSPPLASSVKPKTGMIVVIPVYNEPAITDVLNSLKECTKPEHAVEVILVINNSESAAQDVQLQNLNSITEVERWLHINESNHLHVELKVEMALPDRIAGVGLARKIGMDEALRRFASIDYNGLIVCLDADCTVEANYLTELELHFAHEDFISGNIHYEHKWENEDDQIKSGIIQYELGLRYYVNALRFAGYPYAYHTIGSNMAVSAKTYALAGGMNKRKAGEDFYFLHKLIPLGNFEELTSSTVYPSSRISERVPFGTGRAMLKWKDHIMDESNGKMESYSINTFMDLKEFIDVIPLLQACSEAEKYEELIKALPDSMQTFLKAEDFHKILIGCIKQASSKETYLKRVFAWLDGFRVLKFIHFARDRFYPNVHIEECSLTLLNKLGKHSKTDSMSLLSTYRALDKTR